MLDITDQKIRERIFLLGRPLAPVYGAIMRLRAWLYDKDILPRRRLPALVISVGNLSLGGTGKTPMVVHIARLLISHGRKPAIISRGYGGKKTGEVTVVADGDGIKCTAEQCGDEPRLLAELLPGTVIATGRKRAAVGRFVLENYPLDTIVLDDAFQHLAVDRDINLVLFNSRALANDPRFLNPGRVLPGGPLREPWQALQRADCFIITGITEKTSRAAADFTALLKHKYPGKPSFMATHRPDAPVTIAGGTQDPDTIKTLPLFGFCGIADPESFRLLLARSGYRLAGFRPFPDHHPYTEADLDRIADEASCCDAQGLITTEKDLVKLALLNPRPLPLYALPVTLEADTAFDDFLIARVREVGRRK